MRLRRACGHGLPALLLSAAASAAYAAGWTDLPLPAGAQVADVGDGLRINGLPIQARVFLSPEPVAELAAWFRARLGSPLATSEQGGKTILGQVRSGYYLIVQLEAAGAGTRALVAQAPMLSRLAGRASSAADDAHWQSRLPAGARILSLVQSRDGLRQLQHLVLQSPGSLADSGQALTRMLGRDGYFPAHRISGGSPTGLVLHFQGAGREAMAVLTRDADGMTSIVLSTSAVAESMR